MFKINTWTITIYRRRRPIKDWWLYLKPHIYILFKCYENFRKLFLKKNEAHKIKAPSSLPRIQGIEM